MKKLLTAVIVMCLLIPSFFTAGVHAADVTYLTVFGDSIPDGYALSDQKDNFVNLLIQEYGLEKNTNARNLAVSGATSTRILSHIRSASTAVLKKSDTIIISAGGNDILYTYGKILSSSVNRRRSELLNAPITLDSDNTVKMVAQLAEASDDPVVQELLNDAVNEDAAAVYSMAVEQFGQNIGDMVKHIRSYNSQADIYFLTLYNPISVFAAEHPFFDSLSQSIAAMQDAVYALADNDNRVHTVDVLDFFGGHYDEWTRIRDFDIHPNEEGHRQIFTLTKEVIQSVSHTEESSVQEAFEELSETESTVSYTESTASETSSIVSYTESSDHDESAAQQSDNGYTIWFIAGGTALLLVIAAVIIAITKNTKRRH